MDPVNTSSVTRIAEYEDRGRRVSRAVAARRRIQDTRAGRERRRGGRPAGRAWLNGHELGGTDPRHAHLGVAFD
ncbi:MAG: hypothetical protein QOK25_1266 [Thermoleophilaceae bacterium]|jgi:hypothetical protein|nr:hypothetical protein [Thermoleophilaceae bacterium]